MGLTKLIAGATGVRAAAGAAIAVETAGHATGREAAMLREAAALLEKAAGILGKVAAGKTEAEPMFGWGAHEVYA